MVKTSDNFYRTRGVTDTFSSFEKNNVENATKSATCISQRTGTDDINRKFLQENLISAEDPFMVEEVGQSGIVTSASQSSIVSRKQNQWNMKRDIPVGTVRNNPFLPEPKQPPPQLRYQKKQWDTSNIPKGSVTARIQESNSPRKKPLSPVKMGGRSNGKHTSVASGFPGFEKPQRKEPTSPSTTVARGFHSKSGSKSWKNEPKSLTKISDQKISVTRKVQEDKTQTTKSWDPSREIPNGAVKGRVSSFVGQATTLERMKPNNELIKSTSTNTNDTEHDSSSTAACARENRIETEIVNDDDQWIIPDRNAATQVFASDWGEAIPAKSVESDDWETPAREWIRSGESKSDPFSNADVKKNPKDLHASSVSTESAQMRDTSISRFENRNMQKPSDSSTERKTMTSYTLAPPPTDTNSYDNPKEQSITSYGKTNDMNSSASIFENFSDNFVSFPAASGINSMGKTTSDNRFQKHAVTNQDFLKKSPDAFGFPVSPDYEIAENQDIGEIVGGDEFFDVSVLRNESDDRQSSDQNFELNQYSYATNKGGKNDDSQTNDESCSVKSDSKKKRKGFFKGLFGRKGKEKEYGKIKQSIKDGEKSLRRESSNRRSNTSMTQNSPEPNLKNVKKKKNGKIG